MTIKQLVDRLNIIICLMILALGMGAGILLQRFEPQGWLWLLSVSVYGVAIAAFVAIAAITIWAVVVQFYIQIAKVGDSWRERQRVNELNARFDDIKKKND